MKGFIIEGDVAKEVGACNPIVGIGNLAIIKVVLDNFRPILQRAPQRVSFPRALIIY